MAPPPPPRRAALLLLLSLLLLSVLFAHAARAAPATSRGHAELREGQDKEVDSEEKGMGFTAAEDDDQCGGGAGEGGETAEEECLMRRTLVAHTDYIYTQGGGHN